MISLALGVGAGCAMSDEDDILEGKACDSRGRCSRGYTCDSAHNVCRKGAANQADAQATGAAGADPGAD
jgi:hypothetical protein